MQNNEWNCIQCDCLYVLRAEHTTPSIPYKVKEMLTLVLAVMFITGRMALRLKTGVKAFSSAGWFGSEQFTSIAVHRADERILEIKSPVMSMLQVV